ncbi:MAG TPA: hypothetical protein G4N98_00875 [Thermoflexia bacterium]|nr:hypothetical protein [Thermoflexia bacterium]
MAIKFLSIIVFTFALSLAVLGSVTWWLENGRRKRFGAYMILAGLLIAGGYAFLGSRFSIALLGRLVITVDLPRLMQTALLYTLGVLGGIGLAAGLFLWVSNYFVEPMWLERHGVIFLLMVLFVALVISILAVQLS